MRRPTQRVRDKQREDARALAEVYESRKYTKKDVVSALSSALLISNGRQRAIEALQSETGKTIDELRERCRTLQERNARLVGENHHLQIREQRLRFAECRALDVLTRTPASGRPYPSVDYRDGEAPQTVRSG